MSVACNRNRQIGSYCLLVEKGSDLKFRRPIQPAMYDLEIEAAEGGGARKAKYFPHPHPSPCFWSSLTPLVKISFSPQLTIAINIKDGGHNYRWKNIEYSLAKITPAL